MMSVFRWGHNVTCYWFYVAFINVSWNLNLIFRNVFECFEANQNAEIPGFRICFVLMYLFNDFVPCSWLYIGLKRIPIISFNYFILCLKAFDENMINTFTDKFDFYRNWHAPVHRTCSYSVVFNGSGRNHRYVEKNNLMKINVVSKNF